MSGDVVMATLVNAFYSPLRSSVVVRPLCLLTTKVKYFPRRPSLARPRVRPARVPVVWAPIMSGRERGREGPKAERRRRVTSAAAPPSFPAISEWTTAPTSTRRREGRGATLVLVISQRIVPLVISPVYLEGAQKGSAHSSRYSHL